MKIHLKSKIDLEVILLDNTWYFEKGTIFTFESVGWTVEYIKPSFNTSTDYIKRESIRLNRLVYNKLTSFVDCLCEMTEMEVNIIDTTFLYREPTYASYYKVITCTALEIIKNTDVFEDAIDYKRDELLNNLIDEKTTNLLD